MKGIVGLLRPFAGILLLAVVCGACASIGTVALLSVINQTLHTAGAWPRQLALGFAGLCLVTLAGRVASDICINIVGQRLVARVRGQLARQILSAPIDALERFRSHRLMPVLTHDVDMISDVAFVFAGFVISLAVVLGCLVYMAVLSVPLFVLTLCLLAMGTAVQYRITRRGIRGFWTARQHEDELHKAYRVLSDGAKELRLNLTRRAQLLDGQIEPTIARIRDVNQRAINTFVIGNAVGSALFFLVIGALFGWAAWIEPIPAEVLSGYVLVLLYMKGPVDQVLQSLANVTRAKVAFEKIADLSARFASPEPHLAARAADAEPAVPEVIRLVGVSYRFPKTEGTDPFVLGPIDLTVRAGEILFVVGENGSGKTTLLKLLMALYPPSEGQVLWDGAPVSASDRDHYRQLFTTVFSDHHLFEQLPENDPELAADAQAYLERLELAHKVRLNEGRFSTLDLSSGQRRRLALVQGYLERRPIMVFDEWAADQDPAFRQIFYRELLPDLQRQGKTLIVISHDERYFDVADRVVRLRDGRVV
ncbi:cyclic peptide export ABC transporter [Rhodovibrio salinarum]|uniref:Cyclic peptide transporter n=1 Tax=Rhodovibrio salinarum TaxID=1087 RepID=A0A934V157_9PROT|nr:cyclic peptide export ABC transporter [Rhodovibrio salinarum]MBK1699102.1 cyclic peptide transporter [Rhodovibrio salinarum]